MNDINLASQDTPASPEQNEAPEVARARFYIEQGWRIVPVPREDKNPAANGKGWQNVEWTPEQCEGKNIGVILGHVSGDLTDIDLDSDAALVLAPYFLDPTRTFGRASKPASHWLYSAKGARSCKLWFNVENAEGKSRELVEIRSTNASSDECGHQTVFPGSVHMSGEPIEFDNDSEISSVDASALMWDVSRLAVACIILNEWAEGSGRHEKSLGITGGLLKAGWTAEEVAKCMQAVRECAGDSADNEADFGHDVETTISKFENGVDVQGFGTLLANGVLSPVAVKDLEIHSLTPEKRKKKARLASTSMGRHIKEHAIAEARECDGMLALPALAVAAQPATLATVQQSATTLLERLKLRPVEPPPAFATGIKQLDDQLTFGGVPVRKRIVIGGAPDAGKTAMALQIAEHIASQGVPVAWIAVDEDAEDIDTRRVQSLGCPRAAARGYLSDHWLQQVDLKLGTHDFQTYENMPIDDVIRDMAEKYPGRPFVVVGDSLHTIRSSQSDAAGAVSAKARIDTIVADLKIAQLAAPCLVILTAELARAAYRNKAQSENITEMSSTKESGTTEYAGTLLLVLRSEEDGAVNVTIAKNKVGSKTVFRMRVDPLTVRFEPESATLAERRLEALVAAFTNALEILGRPMGVKELQTAARGAGVIHDNNAAATAMQRAETANLIVRVPSQSRSDRVQYALPGVVADMRRVGLDGLGTALGPARGEPKARRGTPFRIK